MLVMRPGLIAVKQTKDAFVSPLAQRRVILFSQRKQLIGRRAYSDSIRTVKTLPALNREGASNNIYGRPTIIAPNPKWRERTESSEFSTLSEEGTASIGSPALSSTTEAPTFATESSCE